MARFLALGSLTGFCLVVTGWASTPSRADAPMALTSASGAAPVPAVTASNPPPKQATVPVPPSPPVPDTFNRYGNILVPGDEAAHPVRLKMPFPGVGEVKVPNATDMAMREKLEQLAGLSEDEIHDQLEKWPAFSKMSLHDQGAMLMRIQDFREYRSKIAQQKAHDMGLLTLTPEQEKKFEKDYWDKRLQMDRDLARQFEPIYRDRDQKFKDDLYRQYSATSGVPVVQGPKPPTPPSPATNKSAAAETASAPMKADGTASTTEPMMQQK